MKDREIKVAICVLGGCLLVFYGAISYALEIFPYRIVMPPVVAAKAVGELLSIEEYSNDSRWVADVPEKTGMFLKKPGEYESRYTLYVSTNDTTARLLNEDGETLHQWSLSFNKIWPDAAQVNSLFPLDDS